VPFGDAGAYEKIRGVARFSLDPNAAANQRIVDLKLAPRDASGPRYVRKPFHPASTGQGPKLDPAYDVNNRGGIAILGQAGRCESCNNDPTTKRP